MDFVNMPHISENLQTTCIYRAVIIPGLCTCPELLPPADLEDLRKQGVTAKAELSAAACILKARPGKQTEALSKGWQIEWSEAAEEIPIQSLADH